MRKIVSNGCGLGLAAAFLVGAFFRVHGLGRQILLDDEWHGMLAAGTQSFRYLATHLQLSGASIPYSLFRRLCLVTVGWDEVILRLPSLAAGLAVLILGPWAGRRVLKDRAAVLFAFLLALSPALVYYSRYSRVYSVTMLLQLLCVFSFYGWITTKGRGSRLLFIGSAALGAYFHLFCLVPVMACFLYWAFLLSPLQKRLAPPSSFAATDRREGLLTFGAAGGLVFVLYLPSMLNGSFFGMFLPRFRDLRPGAGIIMDVALLMSGTAHVGVMAATAILSLIGLSRLYRSDRLLAGLLVAVFAFVAAAVLATSSFWVDSGLTVVRYAIVLVPLYLLMVALGLEGLWGFLKGGAERFLRGRGVVPATAAVYGLLACHVLTGPLLPVYARVNNFPHHNAFQQDYHNVESPLPYRDDYFPQPLLTQNMPRFYAQLAAEPGPARILEYPMLIGHHFNFHYHYQRLHGKEIVAGYLSALRPHGPRPHPTMVYGNFVFDYYLNGMCCPDKFRFNALVDILDPQAVEDAGVRYVILHEDAMREGFGREGVLVLSQYAFFERLMERYRRRWGGPVYADRWITVFPRAALEIRFRFR